MALVVLTSSFYDFKDMDLQNQVMDFLYLCVENQHRHSTIIFTGCAFLCKERE